MVWPKEANAVCPLLCLKGPHAILELNHSAMASLAPVSGYRPAQYDICIASFIRLSYIHIFKVPYSYGTVPYVHGIVRQSITL